MSKDTKRKVRLDTLDFALNHINNLGLSFLLLMLTHNMVEMNLKCHRYCLQNPIQMCLLFQHTSCLILKEFVPFFILSQYKEELNIEYESFEICVDEYFSQAVKQKEVTKI